jgi:hypothetical protein
MRITIDIDDPSGDSPHTASASEPSQDSSLASAPPDVLAQALAVGAISAGRAPSGPPSDGPPPFIPDPSTVAGTDPTGVLRHRADDAQSAGAAAI